MKQNDAYESMMRHTFYATHCVCINGGMSVYLCDSMRRMVWHTGINKHIKCPIIDNKRTSKQAKRVSSEANKQASKFANTQARTSTTHYWRNTIWNEEIANYAKLSNYVIFSSDCACVLWLELVCVSDWIWHAAQTMSFVH